MNPHSLCGIKNNQPTSQKSSSADATGDSGTADAIASHGDSDVAASSRPILNTIRTMKGGFALRFDGLFAVFEGKQILIASENTWVQKV